MTRLFRGLCSIAVLLSAAPPLLRGQERGIFITGNYDPLHDKVGVVVLPVVGAFGDSIRAIVQRDLDYSDQFVLIPIDSTDPGALRATGAAAGLNYALFARLSAVAVVEITPVATGLHVALHDVKTAAVANVGEFLLTGTGLSRDWRLGVHQASDEITRWVTGQKGIAATRVAFVRGASIRIVDSDGAVEITVPTEENGASPAWNKKGTALAYTTYGVSSAGLGSHIVSFDLNTARAHTLVPATRNMMFIAPAFSPDGGTILYGRETDNASDIFSVPVEGGTPRQLSTSPRGSTNQLPTSSPDGRRIVFVSNREGPPELYIMDADGTNVGKLTDYDFDSKNYRSDPDWAPVGQVVAYQERINDRFQIRTILASGGTPKQLTDLGDNEQPSWAPDGRHLVFTSTRTGVRQLWVLDTMSSRIRQLTKSAGSKNASWSPRLGGP